MEKLTKLFEPGKIGKMELKNRIVLGPLGMGLLWATKPGGYFTDRHLAFYEARAKGGVGLIQLTVVALGDPRSSSVPGPAGALTIYDDEHIPSAQRFTQAIHAHGTKLSFNITPRGIRRGKPIRGQPDSITVESPSSLLDPRTGSMEHALTLDEIGDMIEHCAEAARLGKAAGFDAVRIMAAHHSTLMEFLSPRNNKRKDKYGGNLENRARLACDIIKRVRKVVGEDYPIIIRMDGDEHLEGGVALNEAMEHAKLFVEAGVDALDVSSGPIETSHWQFITMYQPSGALIHSAAAIKKAVNVPVIAVGKINATLGERILQEGSADFIQMARALMVDPELPNKAMEGRLDDIAPCIYCGHCQNHPREGDSTCSVNMALGKEWEYKLQPAIPKKKVMVIGGGPGGMKAALTLAERGHQTYLFEKNDKLGGQWNALSAYLPESGALVKYFSRALEKVGVEVVLNHEVTPRMVEEMKPDAVVVATGSLPTTLNVPGIEGKNVVQATDVLTGKIDTGREVVVIGGRLVGLNAALFLAKHGKSVSVVSRSQIARGITHSAKAALTELLIKNRIRLYPYSILDSVTENGVNVWWNSAESPDRDWVFFFLKAETVVLAVGAENNNKLADELSGIIPEVYPIGDCAGKRNVFAAIHQGFDIACKI